MKGTKTATATELFSQPIILMEKLHLIKTDEKITDGAMKKIRGITGIRTDKAILQLARESGVDIGTRLTTQRQRAYSFFADITNERIMEAREKAKIKKEQATKKTLKIVGDLGRKVNSMYSKIQNIKDTATIKIVGKGGKIYYQTTIDKNNKQTLSKQFRDFIMYDSEKTLLDVLPDKTAKVFMVEAVKPKGKKVKQSFKQGSFNCLLKPIKDFIEEKIENGKTKKTIQNYQTRLNKVNKLNDKYFDSGVGEENILDVATELQIDINISLPFQDNYISAKSQKKPLRTFNFINTKLHHLDYDKLSHEDNVAEVTKEELELLTEYLTTNNIYHTYKKNLLGINEIKTIDTIYRLANPYSEAVNEFEIENNLLDCKICDIKNKDISSFVRQGCHLNQAIDGDGYSTNLQYGKDFLHIDQRKAYSQYKMCKYYKGFLGKITDFRECNKIVDVGYYRIMNIKFKNKKLKAFNKWLKIWNNYNVYPSVELQYLQDNGVTFDIIEGCWGSVIDFDFSDELMNGKTEDGIRYYCKYVGSMMCGKLTNSFYIKGDDEFIENLVSEVSYDKAFRYGNEVRIVYNKKSNYHSTHIAGFITSYMRLNMMEQLEQFEPNEIYRIACDGIYYKPKVVELKNCFRVEAKNPTMNEAGNSYISNPEDYSYINGERLVVGEWRENNKIEVHTGQGGAGKTHHNLIDKGFINPCFYAPSYKLARSKEKDYGCKVSVSQKLTTTDPAMSGIQRRYNNVLIIDEVSMMSNEEKDLIINQYPTCKIIFCGDIGYQLPCFQSNKLDEDEENEKEIKRKTPFSVDGMIVIKHEKNHRVECNKLSEILNTCRLFMSYHQSIKDYVFNIFPTINRDEMNYDYKKDIIISSTHKGKDYFTEKYKELEKYYILKSDRVYGRGEILIEKPDTKDYEIRHAYTCHSIQGETAKNKIFIDKNKMYENTMIYTAISRAKRFNQIVLVE